MPHRPDSATPAAYRPTAPRGCRKEPHGDPYIKDTLDKAGWHVRNASRMKWLVGRWWFWATLVGTLFALPLVRTFLREPPVMPPVLGQAPDLSLTRESGR